MSAATAAAVDVALRDGSTVRVRPIRDDDADEMQALLSRLSARSLWLRFFSGTVDLGSMARWAASRAGGRGYGVVATAGTPERIIGHAAYVRVSGELAEIAFEVEEDRHGQGIGTILLAHLASAAQRDGIGTFKATVHPTNHRMAQVLRDSGFRVDVHVGPGELVFELPASLDAEAVAHFDDRDRIAAIAAVEHVLQPASVAVIGASRRSGHRRRRGTRQPARRRLPRCAARRASGSRGDRRPAGVAHARRPARPGRPRGHRRAGRRRCGGRARLRRRRGACAGGALGRVRGGGT